MSDGDLIAAARTFAQGSPLGKNTWRELDKAIGLIRKMADALEAARLSADEAFVRGGAAPAASRCLPCLLGAGV